MSNEISSSAYPGEGESATDGSLFNQEGEAPGHKAPEQHSLFQQVGDVSGLSERDQAEPETALFSAEDNLYQQGGHEPGAVQPPAQAEYGGQAVGERTAAVVRDEPGDTPDRPVESEHLEAPDLRVLTPGEVTRLRLLLSVAPATGMGELKGPDGKTYPGWKTFERATAYAIGGYAPEGMGVFDVDATSPAGEKYGISCKMHAVSATQLQRLSEGQGNVPTELSSAYASFWKHLRGVEITPENLRNHPEEAGGALIETIRSFHGEAEGNGFDLERSSYLALTYTREPWQYILYQFPLELPNAAELEWSFGENNLRGVDETTGATIFEWSPDNGNLKYNPPAQQAIWHSEIFKLEPLPPGREVSLLELAKQLFPNGPWEDQR